MNNLFKITLFGILLNSSVQAFATLDSSNNSNQAPVVITASNEVVATLDGKNIKNLSIKEKEIADIYDNNLQPGNKPYMELSKDVKHEIIKRYIDRKILLAEAEAQKIYENPEFNNMLQEIKDELSRNIFIKQQLQDKIAFDDVKARYDALVAELKNTAEVKFSFIQVATEKEAKDILSKLKDKSHPTTFEKLAKAHSLDANTKELGGSIPDFVNSKMVAPLDQTLLKLKKGESSTPTKLGDFWYIIKLDNKRPTQVPTFEQLATRIEQDLKEAKIKAYVDSLVKNYTITYPQNKVDDKSNTAVVK